MAQVRSCEVRWYEALPLPHRDSFSPAVGRHERQRLEGLQRIAARLLVLEQPLRARDARIILAEELHEERLRLVFAEE